MKHIWPEVSAFVLFAFIYIAVVLLSGCSCSGGIGNMSDDWCAKSGGQHLKAQVPPQSDTEQLNAKAQPSQSWDQANLKKNDHGCPTAIYVAPGGDLEQCP